MLRASIKTFMYLSYTLLCIPIQLFFLFFNLPQKKTFPVWYHRACLKIMAIKVEITGTPTAHVPCIFCSNHSSYLDIPVLGSLMPISFVAKKDVAAWPFFGFLAKLQSTVFIDRTPQKVRDAQSSLSYRLQKKENLVLFPEGTSSDGVRVLPFKRPLFQIMIDETKSNQDLFVQPITVYCSAINLFPADRAGRQMYAWFGDMDLVPHLWSFMKLHQCTVRVIFHAPLNPADYKDRKEFSSAIEKIVANSLAQDTLSSRNG